MHLYLRYHHDEEVVILIVYGSKGVREGGVKLVISCNKYPTAFL